MNIAMPFRPVIFALTAIGCGSALAGPDVGQLHEQLVSTKASMLFGTAGILRASSRHSIDKGIAESDPTRLVTLAPGLKAKVIGAGLMAHSVDQILLWPNDRSPTHLIFSNEQRKEDPGLQRLNLASGVVETILTGSHSSDLLRGTPWGTVLLGEEAGSDGRAFEIIDPLQTTDVVVKKDGSLIGADAGNVAIRHSLGRLSYEGLGVLPSGVLYYGDENRPLEGKAGGAYFKFIPATPWTGGSPIASLDQSPLRAGRIYGLRLGKGKDNTDFGQASNTGLGTWVEVTDGAMVDGKPIRIDDLRYAAAALKLTGYYRPEDMEVDRGALAAGRVRLVANNTGNESSGRNWGEAIVITDGTVAEALANSATPEVQYFILGNPGIAMLDNVAYQPGRGNWIMHEDGNGADLAPPRNNDLWSCVDDGKDADGLADACGRIGTLNDPTAEWSGGVFDASGKHFFVSVEHNISGKGTILDITGWR